MANNTQNNSSTFTIEEQALKVGYCEMGELNKKICAEFYLCDCHDCAIAEKMLTRR